MPNNPTPLNASSGGSATHEEQSRQGLIGTSGKLNGEGHDVLDAEGKEAAAVAALTQYEERNPDLLKVHSSEVMKYAVLLAALCCVYGLDVLLFGATAEYVASFISGNEIIVFLAKYAVPLFFLIIEVLCSVKIIEAKDARDNREVPTYGW